MQNRSGSNHKTETKYSISEEAPKGAFFNTMSDNRGRELSAEQQEYFKESKARDENGATKTV